MVTGKYVSLDRVIDGIFRDYGFNNINEVDLIEWVGECLDLIGAPMTYIEKSTDGNEDLGHEPPIVIDGNRGVLPCDVHQIIGCFNASTGKLIPMRMSTDITHITYGCSKSKDYGRSSGSEYKLNNGHIFTDFNDGAVVMVYRANPTDKDGRPMIPDNIKYIQACKAYVASKVLFRKEVKGEAVNPRVSAKIDQELAWYTGAANSSSRIPTVDQMESWKNNFTKLIPNINSHASGFSGDGRMEKRFNNKNSK